MDFLITAASAAFVLGLLVFIHELGHFTVAKLSGVKVLEFSLGMGPRIFGISGKETTYLIKALPVGGYVKMLGEEEQTGDPRAISNQLLWKRIAIIAAGATMNFVLAAAIYSGISYRNGFIEPVVSAVTPKSPAETAGIQPQDRIVSANGRKIKSYKEFGLFMYENKDRAVRLKVNRNNTYKEFTLKPVEGKAKGQYIAGIVGTPIKGGNLTASISNGITETMLFSRLIVTEFGKLITGRVSLENVGGPVAIVKMSGTAARSGMLNLLAFAALLSINLGIFNLIPFPALDGGMITVYMLEGITRKRFEPEKLERINNFGFTALMVVMILVTFKDIVTILLS